MLKYFKWFWTYWKRTKLALLFITLFTILTIATKISYPLFLKFVIDELSKDYQVDHAYKLVFFFLLLSLVREILWEALPLLRATMNGLYTAWMRNNYFQTLTKKANSFFIKFKTGDLITRLTDDLDGSWVRICWYSCSGIFRPLEAILILSFSLSVMFSYSVKLTFFTFLPLPLLVYIMHKLEEKILRYTDEKQKSISRCNNILEACFSGIKVVKTTLSEQYQYQQYQNAIADRINKEKKFLKVNQLVHFFTMMVNHFGTVVVILIGSFYVSKGEITLGTLLMFLMYLKNLIDPIYTLSFFWASSKQIFQYVERLMNIDETQCNLSDGDMGEKLDEFKELEFKNVSFKYEDVQESILKSISFKIQKGEKIAIMGAVGCGKTTLLELISRNLVPTGGEMLVNSLPMENISRNSFLKYLGHVRQENILFSESIRRNIVLGDDFMEESISDAVKNSLLEKEIKSFQKGIDTLVGAKGSLLSGGQKQRLAIARTIIRKPQLLLMDDCTASMDAQTESDFWKQFNENHQNCCSIIVTHRVSTAKQADRILLMSDGTLKEINLPNLEHVWSEVRLQETEI
ncbi:MAG: hypothetical protein A2381_04435 [Bdellovibrionales bacterium RIFOXYB1_FULL_37_110]|nr:MAG: hypothetical protein A2417_16015 [Bdellovibrionales bacterium RIFOXYC1_FULL_37_79]OFZ57415.1 MAG: hypothetical protein A2381_04435 [Bdellovibrionales bacterium RIFOXYB1_FULL_37_110]OFZ62267.1 MAG: hypothetical protein A2577_12955 [Bdellovibrionales bacterium RIFOXYD1_FULL_36_51]